MFSFKNRDPYCANLCLHGHYLCMVSKTKLFSRCDRRVSIPGRDICQLKNIVENFDVLVFTLFTEKGLLTLISNVQSTYANF